MNKGKRKCEQMRSIRRAVAEKYGLQYDPEPCTYEDDCPGTCPKCDAELNDLQRQLDEKGIKDISIPNPEDLSGDENQFDDCNSPDDNENAGIPAQDDDHVPSNMTTIFKPGFQGEAIPLEGMERPIQGTGPDDAFPPKIDPARKLFSRDRRRLYKECHIAGLSFSGNLEDVWDELGVGDKLVLVRQKDNPHDRNAVAVALPGDYDGDPDNFDFDFRLGYVPKTENADIAGLLDMGWQDIFDCEITSLSHHPGGEIRFNIYFTNRHYLENPEDAGTLRAALFDHAEFTDFTRSLSENGFVHFRWCNHPATEHDLPRKGDDVVIFRQLEFKDVLYLMRVIAVGAECDHFVVGDIPEIQDDCVPFILTNIKGPVTAVTDDDPFLNALSDLGPIPDVRLPQDLSTRLYRIFSED